MRKNYTIQVNIELDRPADETVPQAVADRIYALLQEEWMEAGDYLMGYEGPLVVSAETQVLD